MPRNANHKVAAGLVAAIVASFAIFIPAAGAATSDATVPGAPQALTPAPGNTTVTLSWKAPASDGGSPIIGYDVYEGTTTGGETGTPVNGSVLITETSATVSGLTNGTLYYFTVAAVNDVGSSPPSNEASATPATVPGAPTSLVPTPGDTSVELAWSAPTSDGGSPISAYKVYEGTTAGGESSTPVDCAAITATSCVVSDLTSAQQYYFVVKAVNAYGDSPASNEVSAIPVPGVAGAPTDLIATSGTTSISLSWTAPVSNGGSKITGYYVYEGTSPGGESSDSVICTPTNPPAETPCVVTALATDTTYYFVVKALNAYGYSAASNEASATLAAKPDAPTMLTATPENTSVALSWTAPASDGGSPITGYDVYEGSTSGGESSKPVNAELVTTTSYDVTGLTNGTPYFFTVTAVNEVGSSVASNEASATPVITAPGAPTDLTAIPGSSSVGLSWTAPSYDGGLTITGYDIYEGTSPGGESPTPVNGAILVTTTAATVNGLTEGTRYYFTVEAVNAIGSSTASNETSAVPAEPAMSKTELELSMTTVVYGHEQVAHLSVTVSPLSTGPTPTGIVTIKGSNATLCVITLSSGRGSCAVSADRLSAGRTRLVATYGGALDFIGSASAGQYLTVTKATTKTALKLSATNISYRDQQGERFSVVVSAEYAGLPSEIVFVRESGFTLCVARLSAGRGTCQLLPRQLPAGKFHVVAGYAGSPDFDASSSVTQTLTVSG